MYLFVLFIVFEFVFIYDIIYSLNRYSGIGIMEGLFVLDCFVSKVN